jgi:hypothetical protein
MKTRAVLLFIFSFLMGYGYHRPTNRVVLEIPVVKAPVVDETILPPPEEIPIQKIEEYKREPANSESPELTDSKYQALVNLKSLAFFISDSSCQHEDSDAYTCNEEVFHLFSTLSVTHQDEISQSVINEAMKDVLVVKCFGIAPEQCDQTTFLYKKFNLPKDYCPTILKNCDGNYAVVTDLEMKDILHGFLEKSESSE